MVSIIEHASDVRAPVGATWLLAGSVAVGLLCIALIMRTLDDYRQLAVVYSPASLAMVWAAAAAIAVGAWRPAPLVLVIVMAAIQSSVWAFAVYRWLGTDEAAQQLG